MEKLKTNYKNGEKYYAADINLANATINEIEDKLTLQEVTYSELIELRNASALTPGMQYRITDYTCVATQYNVVCANNKFDIVVTAIDQSTLSENAKAMHHTPGEPEHKVTKTDKIFAKVTVTKEGETVEDYMFLKRCENGDGTNTSSLREMEGRQFAWGIIGVEATSASTFDEVTDWDIFMPYFYTYSDTENLSNGDILYAFVDEVLYTIEVLDTIDESVVVGGDYFKDCNLDAWELKYSLDNYGRFNWVSNNDKICVSAEGMNVWCDRDTSLDSFAEEYIFNITYNGVQVPVSRLEQLDNEFEGVMYYGYYCEYLSLEEGGKDIALYCINEIPEEGDTLYMINEESGELEEFTIFTETMRSTKKIGWYGSVFGEKIVGLTNENYSIGDTLFLLRSVDDMLILFYYDGYFTISQISNPSLQKGVIYHMKDEWNNECEYDFKNIKFMRYLVNDSEIIEDLVYGSKENMFNFLYSMEPSFGISAHYYTFSLKDLATGKWYDASVATSIGLKENIPSKIICRDNKLLPAFDINIGNLTANTQKQVLNNVVFMNVIEDISDVTTVSEDYLACGCISNILNDVQLGTFGASSSANNIDNGIYFMFGNYTIACVFHNIIEKFLGNENNRIAPVPTNIFNDIWKGTQEEYDNMEYHNSTTLYIITEY